MNGEKLFEKNLMYFQKANLALYMRLREHEPHAHLVFDDNGEPDVEFDGKRLYGMGADTYGERHLARYWNSGAGRLRLSPISSDNIDTDAQPFLTRILRRAVDDGIVFNVDPTTQSSYHVFCLGLGLGRHLEQLVEQTQCRNLIIVEPNFDFVYWSAHVFDWIAFAEKMNQRDGALFHLITVARPDDVINDLRLIHRTHGACFYDGTVVYEHYQSSLFTAIQQYLATEGDMLFTGLGFMEDELNMTANTYRNLLDGTERVFRKTQIRDDIPAIVVGSGPSLDKSVEYIRRNADKALIISCGTSMAPLVRAGIMPDFHVEIERGMAQIVFAEELAEEYDFSSVCLVGSTTMLPEVKEIYPKRVYFFREMLSCYPLFSNDPRTILKYPSPTVTNAGLSFAQEIGIRKFYLFGTDLGFLDSKNHHSSGTQYPSDMVLESDREVRGNFGGMFKSTYVLSWARDTFENAIRAIGMGRSYYNCSDGTLIAGAIPLLPENVDFPRLQRPKQEIVDSIIKGFPLYDKGNFERHWCDGSVRHEVESLMERFIEALEDYPDLGSKRYAQSIMADLDYMNTALRPQSIVSGTVMQMLMAADYYLNRVSDEGKRHRMEAIVREEYVRAFEEISEEVDREISGLQENGRLPNRETGYRWYRDEQREDAEAAAAAAALEKAGNEPASES